MVDHLFQILDLNLEHNGLQSFADLQLTLGILGLARRLPWHSVQLLARPLDIDFASTTTPSTMSLTPFTLIRDVLEDLERRGMLVDHLVGVFDPGADKDGDQPFSIYAGELEYALHRTTTVLARCVEREPTQVVYHAWHLAALAGSMLLCSGHVIGFSSAHPYPSGRTDHVTATLFLEDTDDEDDDDDEKHNTASHEIRRALPKLKDLRRDTVIAFRRLAHLAQHQHGNRGHRMVAAFLEWRQVVALMLGPPSSRSEQAGEDQSWYQNVRELHRYHCTEWALQERTASAIESILLNNQHNSDSDNHDDYSNEQRCLHGLACALEDDPSSIHNWRALAKALGPVGQCTPPSSNSEDAQNLEGSRSVCSNSHGTFHRNREAREWWWGYDRCGWWHQCLLRPPNVAAAVDPTSIKNFNEIVDAVQTLLADVEPVVLESTDSTSSRTNELHTDQTNNREPPLLDWLEDVLMARLRETNKEDDDNDSKPPSLEVRSYSVDQYLPQSTHELSQCKASALSPPIPQELVLDGDPNIELLAYKILILCHLYSVRHESVDRMVLVLGDVCCNETNGSMRDNATLCLQWLHRMNLDVISVYRRIPPVPTPRPKVVRTRSSAADIRAAIAALRQKVTTDSMSESRASSAKPTSRVRNIDLPAASSKSLPSAAQELMDHAEPSNEIPLAHVEPSNEIPPAQAEPSNENSLVQELIDEGMTLYAV